LRTGSIPVSVPSFKKRFLLDRKIVPEAEEAPMSKIGYAVLVAAATLSGATLSASARTVFDGNWSVLIITDRGTCDRAYRYPIEISNGVVHYGGDVVDMKGRVAGNGAVRVVVSRGNQSASGSGRMGRNFGRGVWHGAGGSDSCSGRWEAERR
jgi:uncharacterized membrane protein YgcG